MLEGLDQLTFTVRRRSNGHGTARGGEKSTLGNQMAAIEELLLQCVKPRQPPATLEDALAALTADKIAREAIPFAPRQRRTSTAAVVYLCDTSAEEELPLPLFLQRG